MKQMIQVVPYDPSWAGQFDELKAVYTRACGPYLADIQHVGSTSVPGLPAKPILDIDLVVAGEEAFRQVRSALVGLGYTFAGDLGIPDRYAFRRTHDQVPEDGSGRQWPPHHLYCCMEGSVALRNHLMLRDALRRDPGLASVYGSLKKELAVLSNGDIDAYIEGKSAFIASVLQGEGLSRKEIAAIVDQNRKK